jgi:ERCC4-type nuclease
LLLVDYREGSKELTAPLKKMGLPVEETTLEFGDVAFTGRGEKGKPVEIGVEFKQFRECVASLRTERLQGHQLIGMRKMFDFSYLLVEGEVLFNAQGMLQRRVGRRDFKALPGSMSIAEYQKRILTLHMRGGLHPWHTQTRKETLKFIESLYRTWTDTDLDKHTSHLAIYQAPPPVPISDFRTIVKGLPGIGYKTSAAVEKQFKGSLRKLGNSTLQDWANLTTVDDKGNGKRLGESKAAEIMKIIEGE